MINLSSNYPYSPPDITMLTPSTRFYTNVPICLSYKERTDLWSPSLGIDGLLITLASVLHDYSISGDGIKTINVIGRASCSEGE